MDNDYYEDMSQGSNSQARNSILDGTQSEEIDRALHESRKMDAINRQKIYKLEKEQEELKARINKLNNPNTKPYDVYWNNAKEITSLEAQKTTDEQYLMKQQEIIVNLEIAEEIKGERATEVETQKDRLKFRKASLARAQGIHKDLRDTAYNYERNVRKLAELQEISDQVYHVDEDNKPVLINDLLVKMMDAQIQNDFKTNEWNQKILNSIKANSEDFWAVKGFKTLILSVLENSVKNKEKEIAWFQEGIDEDTSSVLDEIADIDRRSAGIKKLRVNAQRQIFELEKKISYIEEEIGENGQPDVDNLEELDLNKEATGTNNKTKDILRDLRSKLEEAVTGDKMEARFIRELPK